MEGRGRYETVPTGMIALSELRRICGSWLKSPIRLLRRTLPVKGVPTGISFETLDVLCRRHLGESLGRVSYVTFLTIRPVPREYRLFLQTQTGRRWSLFYKDDFSPDGMPASTECLVYSTIQGALAEYLPDVHLCLENIPGRHYQFLLEDLHEYREASTGEDILRVAAHLPAIHDAISEWSLIVGQDRLSQIDTVRDVLRKSLESYAQRTSDKDVSQLCGLWPRIYEQVLEFHELYRPIHWDFSSTNTLIHKKHPDRVKIVDWETVGLGLPHEDLVALLSEVKPAIEDQVLTAYAEQDGRLTLAEHRRLCRWCHQELGLRYIAWMAMLHMQSSPTTGLRVPGYIKRSMRQILDSRQRRFA